MGYYVLNSTRSVHTVYFALELVVNENYKGNKEKY